MIGGGLARIRIFQVRPTFVREFQLFHARDREMEHSMRGAIPLVICSAIPVKSLALKIEPSVSLLKKMMTNCFRAHNDLHKLYLEL